MALIRLSSFAPAIILVLSAVGLSEVDARTLVTREGRNITIRIHLNTQLLAHYREATGEFIRRQHQAIGSRSVPILVTASFCPLRAGLGKQRRRPPLVGPRFPGRCAAVAAKGPPKPFRQRLHRLSRQRTKRTVSAPRSSTRNGSITNSSRSRRSCQTCCRRSSFTTMRRSSTWKPGALSILPAERQTSSSRWQRKSSAEPTTMLVGGANDYAEAILKGREFAENMTSDSGAWIVPGGIGSVIDLFGAVADAYRAQMGNEAVLWARLQSCHLMEDAFPKAYEAAKQFIFHRQQTHEYASRIRRVLQRLERLEIDYELETDKYHRQCVECANRQGQDATLCPDGD